MTIKRKRIHQSKHPRQMLIDFRTLFPKWRINPKGVLHIGANIGEEAPVYDELGIKDVIWIEGNPDIFPKLKSNIQKYGMQTAFLACIGDENGDTVLHISNNGSQSSSILELGTHKTAHPEVHYVKDIPLKMFRVDSLFDENILKDYDFLNIDLQGAELKALKGMGELLRGFRWAYLEVNKAELYKGCALIGEVDNYLLGYGFKRVETMFCGSTGWGDALYIKGR
jgi:FkbM family methyltransferase